MRARVHCESSTSLLPAAARTAHAGVIGRCSRGTKGEEGVAGAAVSGPISEKPPERIGTAVPARETSGERKNEIIIDPLAAPAHPCRDSAAQLTRGAECVGCLCHN